MFSISFDRNTSLINKNARLKVANHYTYHHYYDSTLLKVKHLNVSFTSYPPARVPTRVTQLHKSYKTYSQKRQNRVRNLILLINLCCGLYFYFSEDRRNLRTFIEQIPQISSFSLVFKTLLQSAKKIWEYFYIQI